MQRLIDLHKIKPIDFPSTEMDGLDVVRYLNTLSTVDAVEVDKYNFKLHHIIIDNEGVPEVKIQIGDRFFILHTDPVDVVEVVHGRTGPSYMDEYFGEWKDCLECGTDNIWPSNYCRNCGAKMDGGTEHAC